jgi:hypothetical protein
MTDQLSVVFGRRRLPAARSPLDLRRSERQGWRRRRMRSPRLAAPPGARGAGLISRTRRATARLSHLEAEPLRDASEWRALPRVLGRELRALDALLAAIQSGQVERHRRAIHRRESTMTTTDITRSQRSVPST